MRRWPLLIVPLASASHPALAHVKWFCDYDVAAQPRPILDVVSPDFAFAIGLAALILVLACLVEHTWPA